MDQQRLRSIESELGDLNQEVVKSLRGESEIGITILQGAIEHANARLKTEKQWLAELEKSWTAAQWKKERFFEHLHAIRRSIESTARQE